MNNGKWLMQPIQWVILKLSYRTHSSMVNLPNFKGSDTTTSRLDIMQLWPNYVATGLKFSFYQKRTSPHLSYGIFTIVHSCCINSSHMHPLNQSWGQWQF